MSEIEDDESHTQQAMGSWLKAVSVALRTVKAVVPFSLHKGEMALPMRYADAYPVFEPGNLKWVHSVSYKF